MSRTARIVVPDVPYHITQRGNNRQDVFFLDDDRRVYLRFLADYAAEFGLDVRGWSLMTNHVHLVAVPATEKSLALAIGRTSQRYTQYINRLHRRAGHLWQNRFYSSALDEEHEVAALRYIEQNPVRAKIARVPWSYAWSSASAHVGGDDPSGLLDLETWRKEWSPADWREMLKEGLDEVSVSVIRRHTLRGRPLGSDSFVSRMEKLLGRRLRALPVGRPKGRPKKRQIGD
jgi:putative transposase